MNNITQLQVWSDLFAHAGRCTWSECEECSWYAKKLGSADAALGAADAVHGLLFTQSTNQALIAPAVLVLNDRSFFDKVRAELPVLQMRIGPPGAALVDDAIQVIEAWHADSLPFAPRFGGAPTPPTTEAVPDVAPATTDTDRINWLASHTEEDIIIQSRAEPDAETLASPWHVILDHEHGSSESQGDTLREALDAAMVQELYDNTP